MKKTLALVTLCMLVFVVGVSADGMIIPEPMPPHPHPEYMEVNYHHVNITIDNQFTDTAVDQVFHNPNRWDIEGTYLFPLPEGASIQKFSMYVDGQELEGEVLDAGEARKIYGDLVRKMIDPGLLEYVDKNTFKARVYPIEANSDKRVKIEYSQVISCESGVCEYTYPLDTERFTSGKIDSVVITATIKSNIPIKNIYSPTHEIDIKRISDYEAVVSYEAGNVKPDKDFKLIYTVSEDDIGVNLLTQKDGDTGYFLLMLAPKFDIDSSRVIEKEVVFVLDKSGSMAGDKIDQAKDALRFILNNLNAGDEYGIVTFSTGVEAYKDSLEPASTQNIGDALDYVSGIKAIGGTDIDGALLTALDMFKSDDRPKIVIFLTDGEPTVGVTDINQIIKDATDQNTAGAKLFDFGIGYDVNTNLLDKLSLDNHGTSEYVVEDENIEVKVSNFYEKVDNPVLSDIAIDISGVDTKELYPKELPDVFKGTQLRIFGQYTGSGESMITLTGYVNGVKNELKYTWGFPSTEKDNDFLPRLWATRKIGYLLEQIRLEGEEKELVDEIIDLSKKYGIITPYTSFLILEDEPNAHWEATRDMLAPSSGADAVTASQNIGGYKAAESAGDSTQTVTGAGGEESTIKYVGDKTFIERDGVFVDTDYNDVQDTLDLKYGSDAYFAAVADNPGLGRYFAIGKNLIACVGDVCIKVDENLTGAEDTIGDLQLNESSQEQCLAESDCELTCNCACVTSPSPIRCIRYMDCEAERGITGCSCTGGVCSPILDPNWKPAGPEPGSEAVCGNGLCEIGEGSLSCPQDCGQTVGGGSEGGDDFTILVLLALVVVVLLAAVFILKRMTSETKKKKEKKNEI